MSSFLLHLAAFLGLSYALLDRPQVIRMAKTAGYGLGRSVGMLRNYRQNAEKLMKANPDGQKGMMATMKDLDMVARELRMAMWMARPGAMLRMGPMGGMGMAITPGASQQAGMQGTTMPGLPPLAPGQAQFTSLPGQSVQQMVPNGDFDEHTMGNYEGGSDIMVASWRKGTERTRVTKRT